MNKKADDINGILLIDKPEDWTSHDVVNCVRRRFNLKKVGHCGTLDPIATGLLVLVLGKATKLSDRFRDDDKVYSGVMRLGVETDTEDRAGQITSEKSIDGVTEENLYQRFSEFIGEQEQVPPMVSAVKVGGKKLYELARKGKQVERSSRMITVHDFRIEKIDPPDVCFYLHCSKGTFVRTLCADLGRTLGCGAHVYQLRRHRSGPFSVENAVDMTTVKQWERENLAQAVIPLARVLDELV